VLCRLAANSGVHQAYPGPWQPVGKEEPSAQRSSAKTRCSDPAPAEDCGGPARKPASVVPVTVPAKACEPQRKGAKGGDSGITGKGGKDDEKGDESSESGCGALAPGGAASGAPEPTTPNDDSDQEDGYNMEEVSACYLVHVTCCNMHQVMHLKPRIWLALQCIFASCSTEATKKHFTLYVKYRLLLLLPACLGSCSAALCKSTKRLCSCQGVSYTACA
jgi:hypothetical protein